MATRTIRPLRNEADYNKALAEIERYFDTAPKRGTPDANRFDLLARIIQEYENKRWPIDTFSNQSTQGRTRGASH